MLDSPIIPRRTYSSSHDPLNGPHLALTPTDLAIPFRVFGYNIDMTKQGQFYKVKPTPRQAVAVNNILSGQYRSIASAMREAGYSKKSSFNPRHILGNRRGVQAYLDSLSEAAKRRWGVSLPVKVMITYLDGLEATKLVGREAVEWPDWMIRHAFAEKLSEFLGWAE